MYNNVYNNYIIIHIMNMYNNISLIFKIVSSFDMQFRGNIFLDNYL